MSAYAIFCKKLQSKTFIFYAFCVICVSFVALNIIYSQKFNTHMYGVMRGESESIIYYLNHIWGTSLFNLEIETYKAEGRGDILSKWADIQQKNAKRVQHFENAVRLYPHSPELYYALYLLYSENGNTAKAQENLQKAQQIDPSI